MATGLEELEKTLTDFKKRIEALERQSNLRKVTVPTDGWLIVESHASDPTGYQGRIYYNTTAHKYKVYENATWKTITTS